MTLHIPPMERRSLFYSVRLVRLYLIIMNYNDLFSPISYIKSDKVSKVLTIAVRLLNVVNKTNRDNILQKSKELKDATEPWNRMYLKRDIHPVIVQENSRLRKKKKDLERLECNKEVKIEKGKLKVDRVVVDQNHFFQ